MEKSIENECLLCDKNEVKLNSPKEQYLSRELRTTLMVFIHLKAESERMCHSLQEAFITRGKQCVIPFV